MNVHANLLSDFKLTKNLLLKNRIVMAPMTRRRADAYHTPSDLMIEYYKKRADAGLIITEGALITEDALGYGNVPGIYNNDHIRAWKKITKAVHEQHGFIFQQLWHSGRVSHSNFHHGKMPISASKTKANITLGGTQLECSYSREATLAEIAQLVLDYQQAAKNALSAGFDGIEIHGANGYLVDQFLHYSTNKRQDEHGGSPDKMAQFALAIIHACGNAIGYDKVGIRLSPAGYMSDIITDTNDKLVFAYLLNELNHTKIAYVHTGNFNDSVIYPELDNMSMTQFIRKHYHGTVIASGGYSIDSAANGIANNCFNLISLGRPFIANSDLIYKLKNNIIPIQYNKEMLNQLS